MTLRTVLVLAALVTGGCAQLLSGVIDGAANAAGQRVGQQIVNEAAPPPQQQPPRQASSAGPNMMAMYGAQMSYMYTQFLFSIAFGAGGYDLSSGPFEPGEYVVWSMARPGEQGGLVERAFLAADAEGRQWWRVKFTDVEGEQTTTLEGLFTPDLSRLVRLRGRFPGEAEGQELPVDQQAYYVAPARLSKESIEGATKGIESVTVPAGTFESRHVVFGGPGGTAEWWVNDDVPGGIVKQLSRNQGDEEEPATLVLRKFGRDAKPELGSF